VQRNARELKYYCITDNSSSAKFCILVPILDQNINLEMSQTAALHKSVQFPNLDSIAGSVQGTNSAESSVQLSDSFPPFDATATSLLFTFIVQPPLRAFHLFTDLWAGSVVQSPSILLQHLVKDGQSAGKVGMPISHVWIASES
jgi:hypothetical protein